MNWHPLRTGRFLVISPYYGIHPPKTPGIAWIRYRTGPPGGLGTIAGYTKGTGTNNEWGKWFHGRGGHSLDAGVVKRFGEIGAGMWGGRPVGLGCSPVNCNLKI